MKYFDFWFFFHFLQWMLLKVVFLTKSHMLDLLLKILANILWWLIQFIVQTSYSQANYFWKLNIIWTLDFYPQWIFFTKTSILGWSELWYLYHNFHISPFSNRFLKIMTVWDSRNGQKTRIWKLLPFCLKELSNLNLHKKSYSNFIFGSDVTLKFEFFSESHLNWIFFVDVTQIRAFLNNSLKYGYWFKKNTKIWLFFVSSHFNL